MKPMIVILTTMAKKTKPNTKIAYIKEQSKLLLVEFFYSIQGEAFSIGKPAIFLRFPYCNLRCIFCDTSYVWKPRKLKEFTFLKLVKEIKKYPTNLIVITGGEPLLYQSLIRRLLKYLSQKYEIEIETNGTIFPFPLSFKHKIRYNVSPKLFSSGNPLENRYKPYILKEFKRIGSTFKFVVSNRKDWLEMEKIIKEIKIPKEKIWIMPEGTCTLHLKRNGLKFIEKIKKQGYNFSPRLQVFLWGKKRGV